eukprot:jgi/Mesen1/1225/ME000129S00322
MGRGGCGVDPVRPARKLSGGIHSLVLSDQFEHSEDLALGQNSMLEHADIHASGANLVKRRPSSKKGLQSYTMDEVAKHHTKDDCWVVIKDKVYDVTKFAETHPGGGVIYTFAGKEATDVFSTFHASTTWPFLQQLQIGTCEQQEPTAELVSDFRELRLAMLRDCLFESSKLFYAYKVASTLALLGASVALIACSASLAAVFKWRAMNSLVGGYLFGNILQGFSMRWWKDKHNTHHAAPNECDDKYHAVDPDIDTLPLLAYSKEMLDTVESPGVRAFLRWQAQLFLPILLFARFAWLYGSYDFVRNGRFPAGSSRAKEALTLGVHYAFFFGLAFGILPAPMAVAWLLASQLFSGVFLGIVFVQSHNGMEIYNDDKDFFSAQIVSTRNIKSNLFNDWFTGGLNRQLEHHLFPTLPRHNLPKACARVEALCKKHGLVYEDVGMVHGTRLVLERLASVAAAA